MGARGLKAVFEHSRDDRGIAMALGRL
jgi:hypothetical protein